MNLDDTLDLLSQIALVDDRVVKATETEQAAQLTMWAAILRDVPLDFAGRAVGEHYAESAWPIMPKDIAARWRSVARDRLGRHTGTFEPTAHPHLDPDDIPGYRAALRAQREAVRTGCEAPAELRALLAGSGPVADGRPNDAYRQAREALRAARATPVESEAAS
ncbi:hypothetical protein ABT390_36735 [Streptomyces aurantiacus]|uniref:Uncharacterized protein n=1 Tax=Streptomyces aurantiacus JA 4570 TaxID=1286094 RepID=S3ZAZ0_9ACTN|nr:hypothetical protein [Streptomyces aurantiacus]EPH40881.1 hypothetical protein STRAU_6096 [Streptomyces aurantiacus JA 4570]